MTDQEPREVAGVAWWTHAPPQDGRWLIGGYVDNETVLPFRWSSQHDRWITGNGGFLREEAIRLWADMPRHPFNFAAPARILQENRDGE